MVSKARLDLPEPLRPVMTMSFWRGSFSEIPYRLCSLALLIVIQDSDINLTANPTRTGGSAQSPKSHAYLKKNHQMMTSIGRTIGREYLNTYPKKLGTSTL